MHPSLGDRWNTGMGVADGEVLQANAPLIIYRIINNWVMQFWSCFGILQASENNCVVEKTKDLTVDKNVTGKSRNVEIGQTWESVQSLHSLKHVHAYLYVCICIHVKIMMHFQAVVTGGKGRLTFVSLGPAWSTKRVSGQSKLLIREILPQKPKHDKKNKNNDAYMS